MVIKNGIALALGALAFGMTSTACALPVLDTKDPAVRIDVSGKEMNIGSTAANNVIKWVDFSIAGGEKVAFDKNNYLNYVTGCAASEIFGTLTGGGNIFLINPNGILIGDGAKVNVGNLYLSTRELDSAQFEAFRAQQDISPLLNGANAVGDVVNLGHLEAKTVVVEGNVIKFKNVADVKASTINAFAKTETRVGYDAKYVNPNTYANLQSATWYQLVGDADGLQHMKLDTDGRYMLAGNIKVNGEFTAIGGISTGKFKGRFDGLGYEIEFTKNANVKANGTKIGLFGETTGESVVENVGVITSGLDFSETGNSTIYVGGVVGYNRGTIRNVWHSGSIHVTTSCTDQYVGGIVGSNDSGTIMSAYNTGEVFASGATNSVHVGGIVGNQQYSGQTDALIQDAYNTGNILGRGAEDFYVGGIAGTNTGGNIKNVYNLGSVSAEATGGGSGITTAGGIVGRNNKQADYGGAVSYAYHALGSIRGKNIGAVVGSAGSTGTFAYVLFEKKDAEGNDLGDKLVGEKGRDSLKIVQPFLDDGWNHISAVGGEKKTWRICDGYSLPLLTAFLKPKYNGSIEGCDGTRPAGTYRSVPSVSAQLGGFAQGYDYVSDLTWVLPKDEPTGTKPFGFGKSFGSDTSEYSMGKEYENEIAVLQHPEAEEQGAAWASAERDTKKPVVVGSGVRLPDAMSAEDLEAMLSGTEERENA